MTCGYAGWLEDSVQDSVRASVGDSVKDSVRRVTVADIGSSELTLGWRSVLVPVLAPVAFSVGGPIMSRL